MNPQDIDNQSINGGTVNDSKSSFIGVANLHNLNILIKPWIDVKAEIMTQISSHGLKDTVEPVKLTHGYQPVKSISSKAALKSALYVDQLAQYITLDQSHFKIWKNNRIIKKLALVIEKNQPISHSIALKPEDCSLMGTQCISFEPNLCVYIATDRLQVKLLDIDLHILDSHQNENPSISIFVFAQKIYCGQRDRIIVLNINSETLKLEQSICIQSPGSAFGVLHVEFNRIFAGSDNCIYTFDIITGDRISFSENAHEAPISSIQFYEPLSYTITGSKDGTISIRNALDHPICNFKSHLNEITGLVLLEKVCLASRGELPILISSSLDCSVRAWNLQTCECIYRLDTTYQCLGLSLAAHNQILMFGDHKFEVWDVNQHRQLFASFGSSVVHMRRIDDGSHQPRILAATSDSTIRLLCPLTGKTLAMGYPSRLDLHIMFVGVNVISKLIYCVCEHDVVVTYDTTTNPFLVTEILQARDSHPHESTTCCAEAVFYHHVYGVDSAVDERICGGGTNVLVQYLLVLGMDSGCISVLDPGSTNPDTKFPYFVVHAHTGKVQHLQFDKTRALVLSAGDSTIKVWNLRLECESALMTAAQRVYVKLDLVTVISTELLEHPINCFGIDYENQRFAVPGPRGVIVCDYQFERKRLLTAEKCAVDLDNDAVESDVLTIECGSVVGISATLHCDDTIRIWANDGKHLRDLQFPGVPTSVCFANRRCDLLVGFGAQITLVRVQDYLPVSVLKELFMRDITDDLLGVDVPFDDNIEFSGNEMTLKTKNELVDNLMGNSDIRREDSLESILQRLFSESVYKKEIALGQAEIKRRSSHVSANVLPESPVKDDSPFIIESMELDRHRDSNSSFESVEAKYLEKVEMVFPVFKPARRNTIGYRSFANSSALSNIDEVVRARSNSTNFFEPFVPIKRPSITKKDDHEPIVADWEIEFAENFDSFQEINGSVNFDETETAGSDQNEILKKEVPIKRKVGRSKSFSRKSVTIEPIIEIPEFKDDLFSKPEKTLKETVLDDLPIQKDVHRIRMRTGSMKTQKFVIEPLATDLIWKIMQKARNPQEFIELPDFLADVSDTLEASAIPHTIFTVVEILSNVLSNDNSMNAINLSKTLGLAFETFPDELEPFLVDRFIVQHIYHLANSHFPEVRAHMASSLCQFDHRSDNVARALVHSLCDVYERVRDAAIKSLENYGIIDNSGLREYLTKSGAFHHRVPPTDTYLDFLLSRLQKHTNNERDLWIYEWRTKISETLKFRSGIDDCFNAYYSTDFRDESRVEATAATKIMSFPKLLASRKGSNSKIHIPMIFKGTPGGLSTPSIRNRTALNAYKITGRALSAGFCSFGVKASDRDILSVEYAQKLDFADQRSRSAVSTLYTRGATRPNSKFRPAKTAKSSKADSILILKSKFVL